MEFWHYPLWRQYTKFYKVEKLVFQTTLTPPHLVPPAPELPLSQREPHDSERERERKLSVPMQQLRNHSHILCQHDTSRHKIGFTVWNCLGDGALSAFWTDVNEWGSCYADKLGWQGEQLKWCYCNANVILKFNHAAWWLNGDFFSIIKKLSQMLVLWMGCIRTTQSKMLFRWWIRLVRKCRWQSSVIQNPRLGFSFWFIPLSLYFSEANPVITKPLHFYYVDSTWRGLYYN